MTVNEKPNMGRSRDVCVCVCWINALTPLITEHMNSDDTSVQSPHRSGPALLSHTLSCFTICYEDLALTLIDFQSFQPYSA